MSNFLSKQKMKLKSTIQQTNAIKQKQQVKTASKPKFKIYWIKENEETYRARVALCVTEAPEEHGHDLSIEMPPQTYKISSLHMDAAL